MKKFFIAILSVLSCLLLSMWLVACDENEDSHIHSFSMWNTTAQPTCIADGKRSRTCGDCGFTEYSSIPKTGHQYSDWQILTKATCIEQGIIKYTCSNYNCGHSYTENYSAQTYSASDLYNLAIKFVGEIVVYDKNGVELGLGTGFVYSPDGKIITNYHVIDGAYSAKITIGNKTYPMSQILAYDKNIDLAILQISALGLDYANICKNEVQTGETVYAIGSSRGLTNTYSQGIITQANRVVDGVVHVQHDASITNGNSGGPLLNVYGEVIGINTWGIADSQNLNFAVFTSELDNLVYGAPITLSELYELNNSPYNILLDWLTVNCNASTTSEISFDNETDSTRYSLSYSIGGDYIYISVLYQFDDGADLFLLIDFSHDPSQYVYYATYSYNGNRNTTLGRINASTFTVNTSLTYTSYEGTYWDKNLLLDLYQSAIVDLLKWFDWATISYNMGVNIADIGFRVFKNEEYALDILIDHMIDCGEYNSYYKYYEIEKTYDYTNYDCSFYLYHSEDSDAVSIGMEWEGNDGKSFHTRLLLRPSRSGYFYQCGYIVRQNGVSTALNDTYGVIDPSTFTDSTTLTYDSYSSYKKFEEEGVLLDIYAGNIRDILDWLKLYLQNNNLGITIYDLGFTAY